MLDLTEGYDPTKPLILDFPSKSSDQILLMHDTAESDFDLGDRRYRAEMTLEKNYKVTYRTTSSEKKLKSLDFLPCFPGVVVNQKVIEILKTVCPDSFQYFPVIIKNQIGKNKKPFENHDYYFLHIIRWVSVINIEESQFLLFYDDKPIDRYNILSPKKIRFNPNCMGGEHLARDTTLTDLVLISQELFRHFQNARITGADFYPDRLSYYDRRNQIG